MGKVYFEWDEAKDRENQKKHGVSFELVQYSFADPKRVIAEDLNHSQDEKRYYCFGKVDEGIVTVRFTYWTLDKIALGKLIPFPPMEGFGQVIIFQNYRDKRVRLKVLGKFRQPSGHSPNTLPSHC